MNFEKHADEHGRTARVCPECGCGVGRAHDHGCRKILALTHVPMISLESYLLAKSILIRFCQNVIVIQ